MQLIRHLVAHIVGSIKPCGVQLYCVSRLTLDAPTRLGSRLSMLQYVLRISALTQAVVGDRQSTYHLSLSPLRCLSLSLSLLFASRVVRLGIKKK